MLDKAAPFFCVNAAFVAAGGLTCFFVATILQLVFCILREVGTESSRASNKPSGSSGTNFSYNVQLV